MENVEISTKRHKKGELTSDQWRAVVRPMERQWESDFNLVFLLFRFVNICSLVLHWFLFAISVSYTFCQSEVVSTTEIFVGKICFSLSLHRHWDRLRKQKKTRDSYHMQIQGNNSFFRIFFFFGNILHANSLSLDLHIQCVCVRGTFPMSNPIDLPLLLSKKMKKILLFT